jgi:hypothetical protein
VNRGDAEVAQGVNQFQLRAPGVADDYSHKFLREALDALMMRSGALGLIN